MRRVLGAESSYPRVYPAVRLRDLRPTVESVTGFDDADAPYAAGTGSAVTDLIFSIAKREVTFFSGTALINFL